jgi:protein-ribulosamine 3-kinase
MVLQVVPNEYPGKQMCQGEFESLKAMHAVVPSFIPEVYSWGRITEGTGYYLLAEWREVGQQPPDPQQFTMRVAELHKNSISPNGKFGFHVPTCHGNVPQYTEWEDSWTVMFQKIMTRAMDVDREKYGLWPEYDALREVLIAKVIPRLLDPLVSNGRTIKPCLVHGDLWDENAADGKRQTDFESKEVFAYPTSLDMNTGEPFAFDAGSMYAHNEYEIG